MPTLNAGLAVSPLWSDYKKEREVDAADSDNGQQNPQCEKGDSLQKMHGLPQSAQRAKTICSEIKLAVPKIFSCYRKPPRPKNVGGHPESLVTSGVGQIEFKRALSLGAPSQKDTLSWKSMPTEGELAGVRSERIGYLERVGNQQECKIEFELHGANGVSLDESMARKNMPMIVLLSGLNTPKEWLHPAFVELCKEYGLVLCPDNRGVGGSSHKGNLGSSTTALYLKHYLQSGLEAFKEDHPNWFWTGLAATAASGCGAVFSFPLATGLLAASAIAGTAALSCVKPGLTIEDMADDTGTLIKELELDEHPMVVIGVSMGSMVAQSLAAGKKPPKNLRGVGLLFPGFGPMIGKTMPTLDFLKQISVVGNDESGKDLLSLLCASKQKEAHLEEESQFIQDIRKKIGAGKQGSGRSLQAAAIFSASDRRPQLNKLLETTPVLAIAGKEDELIPAKNLTDFENYVKQNGTSAALSNLRCETIDDVGHWVTRSGEDTRVVLKELNRFLYELFAGNLTCGRSESEILASVLERMAL